VYRVLWVCLLALAACDSVFDLATVECSEQLGERCAECGQLGMACCPGTTACDDNLYCSSGTCERCIVDVALGRRHACAVEHDGDAWCAGWNADGQTAGEPSGAPHLTPVPVRGSDGQRFGDVIGMAAATAHTCALRREGNGSVWCWGRGRLGRLGNGADSESSPPVQVQRDDGAPLDGIVHVVASVCSTCALDRDGGAWCWGCNSEGQLANGSTSHAARAGRLLRMAGVPFTGIAELSLGHRHGCLRTTTNEIWCWGENSGGAVGDGTKSNRLFPVRRGAGAAVAAGSFTTCAVQLDGTTSCSGWNRGGRLGIGEDGVYSTDELTPVAIKTEPGGPPFIGAQQVALGSTSCANVSGDLWCWGANVYGTTGTGGASLVPARVLDPRGGLLSGVDRVVAHFAHACAFITDGRVLCWGRNGQSELGLGVREHYAVPTPIAMTCAAAR
jgi:alpha-tubulin suppressor-like RCC1 family protein